ncbi:MAG: response regulator, partial [Mariprofundus sp.]
VWEACDGELAVAAYKRQGQMIDLVLIDVVMPNKGGVAAAMEIRAMDADVPIVFQTGYGEETQLNAAKAIAHSESLQKPVKIPELLEVLARKLGGMR